LESNKQYVDSLLDSAIILWIVSPDWIYIVR